MDYVRPDKKLKKKKKKKTINLRDCCIIWPTKKWFAHSSLVEIIFFCILTSFSITNGERKHCKTVGLPIVVVVEVGRMDLCRWDHPAHVCYECRSWTGPLACLSLSSVISWIWSGTSIWKLVFPCFVPPNKVANGRDKFKCLFGSKNIIEWMFPLWVLGKCSYVDVAESLV